MARASRLEHKGILLDFSSIHNNLARVVLIVISIFRTAFYVGRFHTCFNSFYFSSLLMSINPKDFFGGSIFVSLPSVGQVVELDI